MFFGESVSLLVFA